MGVDSLCGSIIPQEPTKKKLLQALQTFTRRKTLLVVEILELTSKQNQAFFLRYFDLSKKQQNSTFDNFCVSLNC